MWSETIRSLNPYEACVEGLEKERLRKQELAKIPVLHRTTVFSRLWRAIRRAMAC